MGTELYPARQVSEPRVADYRHRASGPARHAPRRSLFIGLVLAMVVMIALAGWFVAWPAWQRYRTVANLMRALRSDDAWAFDQALVDVRRAHAESIAVPALLGTLQSSDTRTRRWSARAIRSLRVETTYERQAVRAALDDSDELVRRFAADALTPPGGSD